MESFFTERRVSSLYTFQVQFLELSESKMPLPVITVLVRLIPVLLSAALRAAPPVVGKIFETKDDKKYADALKRAAMSQREVVTNYQILVSKEMEQAKICRETAMMHWLVVQALCKRTLEQLETEMFESKTTDDSWLHYEISHYKERIADLQSQLPNLEDEYSEIISSINSYGIRFGVVRYDKSGTISYETLVKDGIEHKENLESLLEKVSEKLLTLSQE